MRQGRIESVDFHSIARVSFLPFGTPLLKPLDSNIQETNRDTKRRDDMNGSIWMGARDGVMVRSGQVGVGKRRGNGASV